MRRKYIDGVTIDHKTFYEKLVESQSAMIAAADFDNIYVVDSASAAMGAEEIPKTLEEEKKNVVIVALVDTLEYLKKGGRASKTVAFAGGVLNIKPVLSVIAEFPMRCFRNTSRQPSYLRNLSCLGR